jgi:parallel beta-helix repeat protein
VLENNVTLNGNDRSYNPVQVNSGGTLVMRAGSRIERARDNGVYVSNGTFTMSGGEISGNTASSSYGGGVYVSGSGRFTKNGGGTISATNTATYGLVAYVVSPVKRRNSAAGPDVYMNSDISGSNGGWE